MIGNGPVAAIDCGTNSTRLLILGASGEVLERRMVITRLGQGVDATRTLDTVAMQRTLDVLRDYRKLMDERSVTAARVVATSAARDAKNAADFFDAATEIVGVRPELLSGIEEGRLSFSGATTDLPSGVNPAALTLVVDIGGGSTELVIGSAREPQDVEAVSLDIGCVRLTERFFTHDPPSSDELLAARAHAEQELRRARRDLPELPTSGPLIGLAGTVSTVASLAQGLTHYDREKIHHFVLTRADVELWSLRLASENVAARSVRPGMVKGREDVIVGGTLVLASVMAVFNRSRCIVSEADILDGLAASLLG